MKRSEMIEKLCQPLKVNGDDLTLHLFPAEAEAVLGRLESLGMLPPGYFTENYDGTASHLHKNKWEPEDA